MMKRSNYNALTERILWNIEEEMWLLQQRTGETDVTIFLSDELFARIGAYCSLFISKYEQVLLFGCKVETYRDRNLSFYVTTAKKVRIIEGNTYENYTEN